MFWYIQAYLSWGDVIFSFGKLKNIIWQMIQFLVSERMSKIDIEPLIYIEYTSFFFFFIKRIQLLVRSSLSQCNQRGCEGTAFSKLPCRPPNSQYLSFFLRLGLVMLSHSCFYNKKDFLAELVILSSYKNWY